MTEQEYPDRLIDAVLHAWTTDRRALAVIDAVRAHDAATARLSGPLMAVLKLMDAQGGLFINWGGLVSQAALVHLEELGLVECVLADQKSNLCRWGLTDAGRGLAQEERHD